MSRLLLPSIERRGVDGMVEVGAEVLDGVWGVDDTCSSGWAGKRATVVVNGERGTAGDKGDRGVGADGCTGE